MASRVLHDRAINFSYLHLPLQLRNSRLFKQMESPISTLASSGTDEAITSQENAGRMTSSLNWRRGGSRSADEYLLASFRCH
ncbi:hypothetical protein K443DRAFT_308990 [Laccaria amethystina LaAM-08-1]|uniref:Uncharacterized protein n=1 Tax=Laccaria amethystina LaAM-08-1 TaxID=1095629 RepID=A0A0C9Y7A9_9AGAR|nr:hypothetical protein K443DRAFT_308990 [Laccaria amethystina LaAM-08-1]